MKIFGYGSLFVLTGSMEPTIYSKELIIIKEQNEYYKNDIITYKDDSGGFVTHRIVDINGENVYTKGDSNNEIDEVVEKVDIQGKVIFHSIILGKIFSNALKPIMIIAVLVYLISFLKHIAIVKMNNK